jgi:mannitol/fructose-specific phosphotransferase system IIA component (Ntr-type)
VGGLFLLIEMGTFMLLITALFLLLGFIWYRAYAKKRATQHSVLIHVLDRLVAKDKELASESLLTELRDIVIQRDKIVEDKFHKLIEEGRVLDIEPPLKMESFFRKISDILSEDIGIKSEELISRFIEREKESSTVIGRGLAIPHIAIKGENIFKVILIRAKAGIIFPGDQLVHILFVFVGSSGDRILHLKVLSAITQVIQSPGFTEAWNEAKNEEELRNVVLLADRMRS